MLSVFSVPRVSQVWEPPEGGHPCVCVWGGHLGRRTSLGLASSSCSHFSQSNSWLTSVVYGPHEVLENLDSSFGERALDKVRVRERKTVQGDGEKNCGTRKQA